ncbi:hypothetical protein WMY93_005785 [Mugilogobius chulae]|uniref:Ubinuclein middle domain-containing protein n=1 Tax=Mugilogobius chulae TaxID=88201 RepID=A0AAW0PI83_9GOBI
MWPICWSTVSTEAITDGSGDTGLWCVPMVWAVDLVEAELVMEMCGGGVRRVCARLHHHQTGRILRELGLLQFRPASDTEGPLEEEEKEEDPGEGPPAEKKREVSKKRKLKNGLDKPPKKSCDEDLESNANPSLVSEPVKQTLKKKKKLSSLSMTSALRRCEKERDSTLPLGPADAAGGGCLSVKTLDLELDCVLVCEDSSSTQSLLGPVDTLDGQGTGQGTEEQTKNKDTAHQDHPEDFPFALVDSIHKLMMASKSSEGESKVKFYTPEVNHLLLQIDGQCQQYGEPLRSRVYSHLCTFLPCNKKTLLRRVGRLRHSAAHTEEQDVDQLMNALKTAIQKSMPEQILSWKESCRTSEHSVVTVTEGESEERAGKRATAPKSTSDGTRTYGQTGLEMVLSCLESLKRLLKLKLEQVHRASRGQDVDQYLCSLLEGDLKPLWPKGWMPFRVLLKESRKLLSPGLIMKKPEKRPPAPHDSSAPDTPTGPAPWPNPAPSSQPPPQQLLVAAVARYKQSAHRWGFSEVTGSPPLPLRRLSAARPTSP